MKCKRAARLPINNVLLVFKSNINIHALTLLLAETERSVILTYLILSDLELDLSMSRMVEHDGETGLLIEDFSY